MRSGGNNFDNFLENKQTKLANFVQFIRMLMFYLEDWGPGPLGPPWLRHYFLNFICLPLTAHSQCDAVNISTESV